jgi:hypothetical protein
MNSSNSSSFSWQFEGSLATLVLSGTCRLCDDGAGVSCPVPSPLAATEVIGPRGSGEGGLWLPEASR